MDEHELHISRIPTAWTMVREAHGDHTEVQLAQEQLLDRYGGAIKRYALSALRDEDAAAEVYQDFALKFVRGEFSNADPSRGRFRAFVKTVVYRLIVDYQRRTKKKARESGMHSNIAEPEAAETPSQADEAMFRTSWRDELLGRCWERLKEDERRSGKPYFTVLRFKVDNPQLRSADLADALSKKLGKPMNAGAIRVALHRARDLFADILLDDVIASLESDSLDEAEQELIDLELHEYCRPALDKRREQPE